jgi:hypothetical protein
MYRCINDLSHILDDIKFACFVLSMQHNRTGTNVEITLTFFPVSLYLYYVSTQMVVYWKQLSYFLAPALPHSL